MAPLNRLRALQPRNGVAGGADGAAARQVDLAAAGTASSSSHGNVVAIFVRGIKRALSRTKSRNKSLTGDKRRQRQLSRRPKTKGNRKTTRHGTHATFAAKQAIDDLMRNNADGLSKTFCENDSRSLSDLTMSPSVASNAPSDKEPMATLPLQRRRGNGTGRWRRNSNTSIKSGPNNTHAVSEESGSRLPSVAVEAPAEKSPKPPRPLQERTNSADVTKRKGNASADRVSVNDDQENEPKVFSHAKVSRGTTGVIHESPRNEPTKGSNATLTNHRSLPQKRGNSTNLSCKRRDHNLPEADSAAGFLSHKPKVPKLPSKSTSFAARQGVAGPVENPAMKLGLPQMGAVAVSPKEHLSNLKQYPRVYPRRAVVAGTPMRHPGMVECDRWCLIPGAIELHSELRGILLGSSHQQPELTVVEDLVNQHPHVLSWLSPFCNHSLLFDALEGGAQSDVIHLLLERYPPAAQVVNSCGCTPLFMYILKYPDHDRRIVQRLTELSPLVWNGTFGTPLHLAAYIPPHVSRYLLRHEPGAILVKDANGKLPFDVATEAGRQEVDFLARATRAASKAVVDYCCPNFFAGGNPLGREARAIKREPYIEAIKLLLTNEKEPLQFLQRSHIQDLIREAI